MNNDAMYKLGYGLYVLTAKEKKDNGCIVNTVMQVTDDPNRIIAAVNKKNYTHEIMKNTKSFNVSMLTTEAPFELFRHFGFQSGSQTDKFADFKDMERAENGIYYITKGTNAYLSAEITDMIDCGTHTLFLANVTAGEVLRKESSVTYEYYQSHIKPKPKESKKTGYRCKICGYVYEGEELPPDFICPICKHGAKDFEKIEA